MRRLLAAVAFTLALTGVSACKSGDPDCGAGYHWVDTSHWGYAWTTDSKGRGRNTSVWIHDGQCLANVSQP